jgi:spore coat polysaccharide biosynthesis protein SpsF (cytidylyltransferase family)
LNIYYSGGGELPQNKWNKDNIRVIVNTSEDEEVIKKLKDIWNRFIAQLIMERIVKLPEEIQVKFLDEIKNR